MLKFIITCIAFDLYPSVTFFYIGNTTVRYGFYAGLFASLGVAMCDFLSGMLAVFGMMKVMEMHPTLRIAMRCISCSYFLYLAVTSFVASLSRDKERKINPVEKPQSLWKFILRGFSVAVTNPGVVMGDALVILQFAAHFPFVIQFGYIVLFAVISFLCFILVSVVFSYPKVRKKLIEKDYYLKRVSALVMFVIFTTILRDLFLDLRAINLLPI